MAGHAAVTVPISTADTGSATARTGTPTLPGAFCKTKAELLRPQMKRAAQGHGTLSQATPTGACWLGNLEASGWRHNACK